MREVAAEFDLYAEDPLCTFGGKQHLISCGDMQYILSTNIIWLYTNNILITANSESMSANLSKLNLCVI